MLKVISTFIFLLISSLVFSQENKVPLCGTPDSQIIDAKVLERMRNAGKNQNVRMSELPMLECLVAVAVEYEIYIDYNKNQDLIKEKVYQYFEKVSKVYEDEMNIKLTVAHIEIIDTPRKDTLGKTTTKFGYHISHLFRLQAAVPGFAGIAYRPGTIIECPPDGCYVRYDLYCISGYFSVEESVIRTIAHEIGHCFDSPHTHNCNWPEGPIDVCSDTEGGCLKNVKLSTIGSIMSYCRISTFSFHPLCRELIRNRANELLKPILTSPSKPIIDLIDQKKLSNQPYLAWRYNLKTTTYQLQVADNQNFTQPVIDSTIHYNFFRAYGFENNKIYYWRVKASNEVGSGAWSETAKFICDASLNTNIPLVKGAFLDKSKIENVRLEVYPIIGVSEYEFRLTDRANYEQNGFTKTWMNNNVTFRVNSPIFDFKELQRSDFYRNGDFYWQVRSIKNGQAGDWTEIQKFNRINPTIHIYPNSSTKLGTTFPITWDFDFKLNREYTLQVAEDKEFTKIYTQKTRLLNTLGAPDYLNSNQLGYEIIENLKPNTTYYYRYREKGGSDVWRVMTFETGIKNTKWKFINPVNQPFWGSTEFFTQNSDSSKIFFVNEAGIYQTDGINWESPLNSLTTKGLISPDYYNLTQIKTDEQNNIYYQQAGAIVKYDGKNVTQISNSAPFNGKRINSFYVDNKNTIYVIFQGNIYKYLDGQWIILPKINNTSDIPSLYFDRKNNLFINIYNSVFKFNGSDWELIHSSTLKGYRALTTDSENNIWWVDYNNVYKQDVQKRLIKYSAGKDYPYGNYNNMIFDRKGVLWMLGEINLKVVLLKFQGEKWSRIDIENDSPLPSTSISDYRGMSIDKQNRVWIFSSGFGIFIYDDSGQVKSQTITAENIANKKTTTKPFKITANATSGLPINYKIISGPAKIQKDSIILTGQLGKVFVQISQSGNEIYEPAKNIELNFEVIAKETQTISFGKIAQKTFGENPFSLTATTTSGLPIIYQIVSGPATINGNTITLTGTGKVIIRASQEGNNDFMAANSVTQEFCVIPTKPTISSDVSNAWQLKVNADKNIQWYFEGKKVINGTQASILASENGKYQVEITNSDASCASNISDVFQLLILATENEQNQAIKVFPNPSDDWITIDSELPLKINGMKIYDMKGDLLYSNDKIEIPHKIKVQHLWKGNAFLEIKTKDKIYIKKLILF